MSYLIFLLIHVAHALPVSGLNLDLQSTKYVQPQKVAFEETYDRTHGLYEISIQLLQVLPHFSPELTDKQCYLLTPENYLPSGGINPHQGKSIDKQPGAIYINLYYNCIVNTVNTHLNSDQYGFNNLMDIMTSSQYEEILSEFSSDFANEKMRTPNLYAAHTKLFLTSSAKKMSRARLSQITEQIIEHIVGPREVWGAAKLIGDSSIFNDKPRLAVELIESLSTKLLSTKDELNMAMYISKLIAVVKIGRIKG